MAPLYRYKLDYHAVVGLQIAKAGKHKGEIMIMLQLKEAEATVRKIHHSQLVEREPVLDFLALYGTMFKARKLLPMNQEPYKVEAIQLDFCRHTPKVLMQPLLAAPARWYSACLLPSDAAMMQFLDDLELTIESGGVYPLPCWDEDHVDDPSYRPRPRKLKMV
ncbi:hypothetical protein AAVH_07054 [Aphelenchoides avenae]|nr:hypothetical protein AAVH_07052 [Aphelenchus avenae]KAH7725263.1 hypothetical protein AAVH_07054 [Aphelenchus avenae]